MTKSSSRKFGFASCLGLALLLLPASVSVAQANREASRIKSLRLSFWLDRVPISVAMTSLFGTVGAKVAFDPAVTGSVSVNVSGVTFEDALRAFINGADQPIYCSREDGVYFVGLRTPAAGKAAPNRVGVIGLPADVKVVDVSGEKRLPPVSLPFVYTTPDGCFQAAYSKAIDPFTNSPPVPGMIRHNLMMDGTVVIRILAPNKMLSVSHGEPWTLSDGTKSGVLNLSPIRSTLFDTGSEIVRVSKGVVTFQDKSGRSVTIYPYAKP